MYFDLNNGFENGCILPLFFRRTPIKTEAKTIHLLMLESKNKINFGTAKRFA